MIQNFAILGGDARQTHLAAQLMAAGFSVSCRAVPHLPDTHASLHDTLQNAEAVLLPVPALQDAAHIKAPTPLSLPSVAAALRPGAKIFGGVLPDALFAEHPQFDYLKDESFAVQNAALTAEGALALALVALPCGLAGQSVLVIGFGRIGKLLARKLQSLGAAVTVSARKPSDLGWCAALGYRPERTGFYDHGLSSYRCVFNTVPAPVFTASQLVQLRCPILDLASAPGCLPPDADPPALYQRAACLPARFAPEAAARILKDTTLRLLAEEQEALWNP